jgi:hypothetical protein
MEGEDRITLAREVVHTVDVMHEQNTSNADRTSEDAGTHVGIQSPGSLAVDIMNECGSAKVAGKGSPSGTRPASAPNIACRTKGGVSWGRLHASCLL